MVVKINGVRMFVRFIIEVSEFCIFFWLEGGMDFVMIFWMVGLVMLFNEFFVINI